MAYIYIKDFRTGLDGRKMPETSIPGTLLQLDDGHVTRGGEVETRLALVAKYSLPVAQTFGLSQKQGQLYAFGSVANPSMPVGVKYQRLQHPSALAMARILDVKNFNNKIYAVAEYSDGTIYHFYDGSVLADWVDGRSRGNFLITAGSYSAGTPAEVTFLLVGGANGDQCTSILIDSVEILGVAVDFLDDIGQTAELIAAQINAYQTNWIAVADTASSPTLSTVRVYYKSVGLAQDSLSVAITADFTAYPDNAVTYGGDDANAITSITVDGVEVLGDTVLYSADGAAATADAVAAQINDYISDPNYSATSYGAQVNILAVVDGTAADAKAIVITSTGDVTTGTVNNMDDGATDPLVINVPATRVKVAKSKIYAVAPNGVLYFCAINDPTKWLSGTGYGNINLSQNSEGSEDLLAVDSYYQYLAVFAKEAAQIWAIDADPDLNALQQPLNNTGTIAAKSVQAYGDNDVFFLADSGVRSLRARDASNAAAVSDVGTPVDGLIQDRIAEATPGQVERACSVIEPVNKRYLLDIGGESFVFTFYSGSKISAWSKYLFADDVGDFVVVRRKMYVRSGDTVYLYGGDDGDDYTDISCVIKTPFLDADNPAQTKQFVSFGVACEGSWLVEACTDPNAEAAAGEPVFATIGTVTRTTFGNVIIPFETEANYVQFRLTSLSGYYARIGSLIVQYKGD